ncbi:MAG TPA: hypothetical protein VHB74_14465, partial [Devosia sp.]|nr:hypothetical protein [Devosia sp.]
MSDTVPFRAVALLGAVLLAACGAAFDRPVGDFGRAEPDPVHDDLMPSIGAFRARLAGEPVSGFNLADEEKEMADRVWRFETSGHIRDWAFDVNAELQRTRVAPPPGKSFGPERYYNWLHSTRFQSAKVRYATLADDIHADIATIPATFAVICKVEAIDRQRQVAAAHLPGLESKVEDDLHARLVENDRNIDLFVDALDYRHASYSYALDHLLVETPYPAARDVDADLAMLKTYVALADRWQFCGAREWAATIGNPHPG